MAHLLDNPAWNALISGNRHLAHGTEQVKLFAADVSPFVGFETPGRPAFEALHALVPAERRLGVMSPGALEIPPQWQVLQHLQVYQMVQEQPDGGPLRELVLVPLGPEHVPAMLALTKRMNPGPFFSNTIAFGHYQGIFDGDELVAMAGQRLHAEPFAEISAVCTHPDYFGRGYASHLMRYQAQRIWAGGGIPFLHVRTDNATAVKVYQAQGFTILREMSICIMQPRPE
ncbi:GNAT family N-acetyltransferase [Hymenobacter glaciei]|uniref:GNAT family N-acetyltransferase n=1 Tax=Hymenobacter glaciei TaxID=877209 RepID=A0ABP7UK05_9BACT